MSKYIINDMAIFHNKFKVRESVNTLSPEMLREFLEFRVRFLNEEMTELKKGLAENNWEEVVDALIDLTVVALGTLDAYSVDVEKAWNEVLVANMAKEPGIKASRPNKWGFPDMIKPDGWKGPDHSGNHGLFALIGN